MLVLDLKVPHLPPGFPERQMIADLEGQIPNFVAWLVSFILLARFWIVHHAVVATLARCHTGTLVWNFVVLADARFAPLWAKANELGAVIDIHATDPAGVEAMLDYWLMPLVGFLMNTTLAASKLVFTGVVARHPRIRWVLTHMGGAIPYLDERLDRGYRAFADCREHIDRPPAEYLKHFYYDTVNFNLSAIRLALDFAGPDRILAGSDYPHQIGSIPLMIETIKGLDVSDDVREKIFGGNAARLPGPVSMVLISGFCPADDRRGRQRAARRRSGGTCE